ncbi:hypothetical protein V8G54_026374 [Vigna mungo]|uniref:Uncharacterized protein n=1 Tax=Vigna mungo TaxID=3915 RepID=A0AAQ3N0P2_VIGMU
MISHCNGWPLSCDLVQSWVTARRICFSFCSSYTRYSRQACGFSCHNSSVSLQQRCPNPLLILSRFPINNQIRVFKSIPLFSFVCASLIPFRSNPRSIPISIFSSKIKIFFISREFWV